MPSVVFICVANSARSQMAEGLARSVAPEGWEVHSAGSRPATVNPLAIEVLKETGIDASHQRSKPLAAVPLDQAEVVITLCAEEACPVLPPAVRRVAWPLPDPASAEGDESVRLDVFRRTRDELRDMISGLWDDAGQLTV